MENRTAQTRQRVGHADVFARLALFILAELAQVAQQPAEAEGSHLQAALRQRHGIGPAQQASEGVHASPHLFPPELIFEPLLMAAFFPLGDMIGFEVLAGFAEALDNVGVRDAIEEPVVDLVADGFGEASDFAIGAARCLGFGLRAGVGGLRWCGGRDLGFCGHRREKSLRFGQIYSDLLRCGAGAGGRDERDQRDPRDTSDVRDPSGQRVRTPRWRG